MTETAVDDAFVGARRPDGNRGSFAQMRIDGSPVTDAYIKFDVTGVNGTVTDATLRLYAENSVSASFDVHEVSNTSWDEGSITYNNAPSLGSVINSASNTSADSWIEIDVSGYVYRQWSS